MMIAFFRIFFLQALILSFCFAKGQVCDSLNGVSPSHTKEEEEDEQVIQALTDWLQHHNGFLHPNLEIRRTNSNTTTSSLQNRNHNFGIFVQEPIPQDEQLLYIPSSTLIMSQRTPIHQFNTCHQAKALARERNLHRRGTSDYGPYLDFLERFVVNQVSLPGIYSDGAKDILESVVQIQHFTSLVPFRQCFLDHEDDDDDAEENRNDTEYWNENILVALSRGKDTVLCPVYDIINHSNRPDQINVEPTASVTAGHGFAVQALRDLQAGDELFYSYYDASCMDCGNDPYEYGTPDLFRDYGFVEEYPQRWHFHDYSLNFAVHKKEKQQARPEEENQFVYTIEWMFGKLPDDDGLFFLEQHMENVLELQLDLQRLAASNDPVLLDSVPPHELQMIHQYINALVIAMDVAIKAGTMARGEESDFLVGEEHLVINHLDDEYHLIYQCMTLVQKFNDDEYDTIEVLQSAYQTIEYQKDPKTDDICFYLDNVFQMCWSYWPHYHEGGVHKVAKYISKDIKRVLWVGGGDSGLLNEIVKYPSLELAVGLELDQQVTRLAFKHFAAIPHYDNPKVEWWYGDASKSILMLPKEYFGSFDLVLVDLSDTLFSLSVSAELDVIEALSLLVRPGGVFEMNEPFFKRVSDVFEYTIHYTFQDVPKVCDQSFIMASNDLDFLYQRLTEHSLVENTTLFVEQASLRTKSQFDMVHDFRRNPNPATKRLCKTETDQDDENKNKDEQENAPGILMIVEAENLTVDLESPASIRAAIVNALEQNGMHVLSDDESPTSSRFTIIMLKEGYVVVRAWPKWSYCALDIHLWSAFDMHSRVEEAIVVDALGGDLYNHSTTSYRIVAGGMFGMPTWKEDSGMNGPQISRICSNTTTEPKRDAQSDVMVFTNALETSLAMVQGSELVVAVLCNATSSHCPSLDVLEGHPKVEQVIPIRPCPLTSTEAEQFECSMQAAESLLDDALPDYEDLIDVIVLDWDAPIEIRESIDIMIEAEHLNDDNLFVIGTIDSKEELWRRRLVDNFRKKLIVEDPVFRAHLLFNTTTTSLEVAIVSAGDPDFFEHLTEAVAEGEKKRQDVTLEIRNVIGGKWRSQRKLVAEDWEASQFMVEDDYNNEDALVQWKSQFPLATQSISQYTHMSSLEEGDRVRVKRESTHSDPVPIWLEADIETVNENGSYNVLFDNGDVHLEVSREKIKSSVDEDLPAMVNREEAIEACRYACSMKYSAEVHVFTETDIGGDGIVCTGIWESGTAVVLWDGRFQVDINVWSVNDLEEIDDFENDVVKKLPNLVSKLRDVQPRGFGRVVNFKEDIL